MPQNDNLDYWTCGSNKATEIAQKQYQAFLKKRHGHEEWDKPTPQVYHTCSSCVRYDDNHAVYHRDEMLEIKNAKGKVTRRLCRKHAEKYKPHSERVGGKNY